MAGLAGTMRPPLPTTCWHPSGEVNDGGHRSAWDPLKCLAAAGGVVERDAGLVRGFELHLVADRGGEGQARNERQEKGKKEGSPK
jgi:hypothetical protein